MSEVVLTEQLDQAIDAMFGGVPPAAEPQVEELLSIAAELRELPRAGFRGRLREDLETEVSMTARAKRTQVKEESQPAKGAPERQRFRTVTPYLVVPDVHAVIEFITKTFGAEGKVYGLGSAGGFHSEYRIGDTALMIGGGGKGSEWKGTPRPSAIHLYVKDVDATHSRAVAAGGESLMAPADMEYGERGAAVRDPGGNNWYIATAFGPGHIPEGLPDLMPYFNPRGALKMIDFLKQAFLAEEVAVHQSPDGVVQHAKVRIGNSIVEMGEAHGQWQPMPMNFMLYVDDVDAWYTRAMKVEGTVSMGDPSNQAYGDRIGTVQDPFDNIWYIATAIRKNS